MLAVAIGELLRVLKPGGLVPGQHPVEQTLEREEDPSITSPRERHRLFGQWDHVRVYRRDFTDRLREAGFDVTVTDLYGELDTASSSLHGLADEPVWVCRRPTAVELPPPRREASDHGARLRAKRRSLYRGPRSPAAALELAVARLTGQGPGLSQAPDGTIPLAQRRTFAVPLAVGAPAPPLEILVKPARMIHFFDPSNEKMAGKLPELAAQCDILLGNLEDAVPVDRKEAAREGLVKLGREVDFGEAALWTRVNALESPWALDDLMRLVGELGDKLEVIMVPKVEGAWDIHYVDRLLAQLEARHGLTKPILVHAILESALGVTNLEEIAAASPRMQGISFGPADLAASRRMKTTRVGGGHPGYRVIEDPPREGDGAGAERASAQQDLWHYSLGRMVDACAATGILPFYGPFGDIADVTGCETQFRAAFLMGCVGAWTLHPRQIEVARRVFSPNPEEVRFAKRVIEAIPDGRGVHMIDGKMQDDATWKQCKVMVSLAEMLAHKDPALAEEYGLEGKSPEEARVEMEEGAPTAR